jgi:hypothetical protein
MASPERPKVLAVDWDGTLAEYGTEKLLPGAAKALTELIEKGWRVLVFTSRQDRLPLMRALAQADVLLTSVQIETRKPDARVYLDDRALEFNGSWDEVASKVEHFRPWHIPPERVEETMAPDAYATARYVKKADGTWAIEDAKYGDGTPIEAGGRGNQKEMP